MLKLSELRIGNVVKYKKGHISKIVGINYQGKKEIIDVIGVESNYINASYETNNFYGIKITKDILKDNLNFKGRVDFVWNEKVGIIFIDDKFLFAAKDMSNVIYKSLVEVKYVHEVQNLFYDLMKKDLEYKVKEK